MRIHPCFTYGSVFFIIVLGFVIAISSMTTYGKEPNGSHSFFGCKKFSNYECEYISKGLKVYSLLGNGTDKIEISRTPVYVEANNGKAVQFEAKNYEAISVGDSPGINAFNFSISFWLKISTNVQPYSHILSHVDKPGTSGWYFDMFTNSSASYVRLRVTSTDAKQISSVDVPVEKDKFVNIVGTFNGSSISIYKDFKLQGSTPYSGKFWPFPLLPLTFGSASYGYAQQGWSGVLNNIVMYNKTVEPQNLFKAFSSVPVSNKDVVGYWKLDENLNDTSQYHNHGIMHTLVSSMAFAPDGKLYFAEKNTGNIMVVSGGKNDNEPSLFIHIPDSFVSWEQGLLGITIDPLYTSNHFVYLYYTSADMSGGQISPFNRVARFTERDGVGKDETILMDKIPASNGYHSGGALAFGPDGKLYITVGDATEHIFAQDPSVSIGKVLRINRDGSIPSDNPYKNSPVFTLGHRNMYGIAFNEISGLGIVTENGDFHYDEVNILKKAGNYGFPTMQPPNIAPELSNNSSIKPVRSYLQTIGPTQALYYDNKTIPELTDKFLFGTYTGYMYALRLNGSDHQATEEDIINFRFYPFEPIIAITKSPKGAVYFGGYNIYKLELLNPAGKTQIGYPMSVDISGSAGVRGVMFDEPTHELSVQIAERRNNLQELFSSDLKIEVPNGLLSNITQVQINYSNGSAISVTNNATIPSSIQLSSSESGGLTKLELKLAPNIESIKFRGL